MAEKSKKRGTRAKQIGGTVETERAATTTRLASLADFCLLFSPMRSLVSGYTKTTLPRVQPFKVLSEQSKNIKSEFRVNG